MKDRIKHIIAFIIIVLAALFIEKNHMNEYPQYIHAWAEQDHYALALGFIDNGYDFFHPQTMIYNKQFPGWWAEASANTVTSVDFPIHEYAAALLMSIFGTSPWVFRLWTLLLGLIGLIFLYKIAFSLTNDILKSVFVTFIALTTPVFAYYLNGFLPGIPALTFGIIGLWFYIEFINSNNKLSYFNFSIAFLTFAMLIRTTFAIEFVAILCFEMLRIFRKESSFVDKIPAVLAAFLVFGAYFLWKRHLDNQNGSVFLNYLLPAENLSDAKDYLHDAYHNWRFHYFQKYQYYLILAIILLTIGISIYKAITKKMVQSDKKPLSLFWLPIIYIFGCVLFCIAMMQQLPNHDYYFIDTLFLPILLIIILIIRKLPVLSNRYQFIAEAVMVMVLCFFMIRNVEEMQVERRYYNGAVVSYENFKDSREFLDSLGVSRDAKILCLFGYAQNGPFIQMGRKGFSVMQDIDNLVNKSLSFDYDYVVIENCNLEKCDNILSRFEKISDNGKITIFTPLR